MRLLNIFVIGALILAASFVYKIKFDSTLQAERVAKAAGQLRRERDAIAALRAEWGELENPTRIEALTKRYLHLKPVAPTQFDKFNALPERPPQLVSPDSADPIGEVIENFEESTSVTGSIWPPSPAPSPTRRAAGDRSRAATPAGGAGAAPDVVAPAPKSGRLDR